MHLDWYLQHRKFSTSLLKSFKFSSIASVSEETNCRFKLINAFIATKTNFVDGGADVVSSILLARVRA